MRRLLPVATAAATLALAPHAGAEPVATGVFEAELAVGRTGTPHIAYARADGSVYHAVRGAAGWRTTRVFRAADARVAGVAAAAAGPVVLVEHAAGGWLALVEAQRQRWRTTWLVRRVPFGVRLGRAGLALDTRGRPVVAYARRNDDDATQLSLVRRTGTRLSTAGVTRDGFPRSSFAPSAAPVLMPNGAIRVLQVYAPRGAAAFSWRAESRTWWGRLLFANVLGQPTGPVLGAADPTGLYATFGVVYPTFLEEHTILAVQAARVRSSVLAKHALPTALALSPEGPEVAANEWVGEEVAGLVLARTSTELDGHLAGLEIDRAGRRHVALAREGALYWHVAPGPLATRVTLEADLSGRVDGASGGVVDLYREDEAAARVLVASASVEADGSFAFEPQPPALYRAVYEDPGSGVPYGALLRG